MPMRSSLLCLLLPLVLAACGSANKVERGGEPGSGTAREETAAPLPAEQLEVPVTVGDLGANFPACQARGSFRRVVGEGGTVEVKAAPFDASATRHELPATARFFICARSHDQKWLGIVFDAEGDAAPECGVSRPAATRRDYAGPCRSGWVSSAVVAFSAV